MVAAHLIGPRGEELVLCSQVSPHVNVAKWLQAVEQSMKASVQFALEACLQARLADSKLL